MHTDRKIGFAMGILLIGIVAALFFRNEPLMETDVSGVRRESELNERLRERDVAVYLNDVPVEVAEAGKDEQPSALRDVLRNMNERNKSRPSAVGSSTVAARAERDGRPEPSLDGFRRIKDAPDEDPEQSGRAVESLPIITDPQKLPALFPPADSNPGTELPESDTVIETSTTSGFQPPEDFEEYTVKFGDTLSGIAQKTLGSPNRYKEIYEANRDRMASPDRLDIGKTLRIPRMVDNPPRD
jgi:nucleoid-associated protein YgaU